MLYRLFPYDPASAATEEGGALFVPRALQGPGRHDDPSRYGALYTSRSLVSVVAERIRRFRDRPVAEVFLRWERDLPFAIARLDDERLPTLVDLDHPANLVARDLRPSEVATGRRRTTKRWARALHAEGAAGFEWWSTIEASWINVTLFAERALPGLAVVDEPEPLTLDHPAVIEAAETVGVTLAS